MKKIIIALSMIFSFTLLADVYSAAKLSDEMLNMISLQKNMRLSLETDERGKADIALMETNYKTIDAITVNIDCMVKVYVEKQYSENNVVNLDLVTVGLRVGGISTNHDGVTFYDLSNPSELKEAKACVARALVKNDTTRVVNITDTSLKLTWAIDPNGYGFSVFREKNGKYEIIQSVSSSTTELLIDNLKPETNYEFIVCSLGIYGSPDCKTNKVVARTLSKKNFVSCNEIKTYYSGLKPSGYYKVDSDGDGPSIAYEVYCDMDNNNGGWTRVFTHKMSEGLFLNNADALEKNITIPRSGIYSILKKLAEYKRDGKFEFWIHYPDVDNIGAGNIWTQISNPIKDPIAGYVAIREEHNGQYWGGLEKSSYPGTLIDGSVGHSWWYYSIGASRSWPSNGTIPGALRGAGSTEVQLFIR